MKPYSYLILLPCVAAAAPAFAFDQSAQSTAGLTQAAEAGRDIVVTANREARPIATVGQAVTVLDSETITHRQASVVSDLLRQTPGVVVTRNGGPGTTTSVNIRGADSDQTVALIDGIKLNDPSSPGGGFNFGNLLIGNITRIEVLRGAQSVLWGSQAIGGVVNLITRQPTETLAVNARAEGGWHDTGQVFANISGKSGPVSASLGGGYYTTDGVSTYAPGTERDGFRNYAANGSLGIALAPNVSVDLRGFYMNGRTDIDGFPAPAFSFGDTREYGKSEQWLGYAGLNAALFEGKLRNRFGYARTQTNRRNFDPDGVPTETFAAKGRNERLEYQGVADLTSAVFATFGAEREVSRFSTSSYGGPVGRGRARIFSVYGQLAVTPIAGLTATGGVRHDDHNVFGGATTFSGSGVYSPNDGATAFRASYSEGFKAPTLYQLQSEYGNTALDPERSRGWDAGVTQRALGGKVEASATYFRRTSRDLITFVSCDSPLTGICTGRADGTYDNIAKTRAQGVEFSLLLRPVEAFTVSASYTYLDAVNRSEGTSNFGRDLPRRPGDSVTVNADYRWPFGLTTGATITAIGDSFDNASNARRLDGYVVADVRASFPVGEHVEVYGRIENAFNARYQTIYQYGQPGRGAFGGVRLTY
ncbi:TonB-dependent receptor plug domain-containing protein [Sphingomonas prati]|uniref:Vitamin B12 transporter n=1 Tax=Sphingomonas prati TaxID=1843237 RepID=A0A7W9BQ13_9SPHN|nr:TonB-dependent receptor [Sphingomonas prati]MBB5728076.1 vitamin B12 transporter [Sphingomonas prati]GGE83061.1 TonB-dependent receptor [Sphingomonas prati]